MSNIKAARSKPGADFSIRILSDKSSDSIRNDAAGRSVQLHVEGFRTRFVAKGRVIGRDRPYRSVQA